MCWDPLVVQTDQDRCSLLLGVKLASNQHIDILCR